MKKSDKSNWQTAMSEALEWAENDVFWCIILSFGFQRYAAASSSSFSSFSDKRVFLVQETPHSILFN